MRSKQIESLKRSIKEVISSERYICSNYDNEISGVDNCLIFTGEVKVFVFLVEKENNNKVSLTNAMPKIFTYSEHNEKAYFNSFGTSLNLGPEKEVRVFYLSSSDNLWNRYFIKDDSYKIVKNLEEEIFLEKLVL